MLHRTRTKHAGFSAIELIAVIVVLTIASGVVLPAVQQGREAGDRMATMNNLKQCVMAAHLAHDNYKKFPTYYGPYASKREAYSWHAHLLPFVDQAALYKQEVLDTKAIVPAYLSALDPTQTDKGAGAANYPVNLRLFYTSGGLGTLSPANNPIYPRMPNSFSDGTSNTLMYATKYHHCGKTGGSRWADTNALDSPTAATFGGSMALWQKAPGQAACDPTAGTAVSFNLANIQVALVDASVRNVSANVTAVTWQAVHTPGAADIVGADWNH
jgi:prepilin-type N-terminal cleavage/methylation domain-containing protein